MSSTSLAATPGVTTTDTVAASRLTEAEAYVTRNAASRGYQGLFRVSTQVIGAEYNPAVGDYSEKEIDVDDRDVKLMFTLEMADDSPWRFKATNLQVTITLRAFTGDFTSTAGATAAAQNIEIAGVDTGTVTVFSGDEIFPGAALHKILNLKTGIFSSAAKTRDSATPGVKEFPVTITYALEPFDNDSFGTSTATALLVVASD